MTFGLEKKETTLIVMLNIETLPQVQHKVHHKISIPDGSPYQEETYDSHRREEGH